MDLKGLGFREDFDPENRIVKQESFKCKDDEYYISTVDLGIDHRFGEGPPLYFETMIFEKSEGGLGKGIYQERYSTRKEAIDGHLDILKAINNDEMKIIDGYLERV